ncbi:MAG: hypothetical protein ACLP7I_12205 [Limisphaerales bacterium]
MNSFPSDVPATPAEGPEAERGEAAPAPALPCQYNDNCIEKEKYRKPSAGCLTPSRKKIRQKMIMAVEWMVRKHGIERVGVLTLSFGVPGSGKGSFETWALRQQAKEWDFVQNRWHSFCTNVVAKRYQDWLCVFELHRDRVWFCFFSSRSSKKKIPLFRRNTKYRVFISNPYCWLRIPRGGQTA